MLSFLRLASSEESIPYYTGATRTLLTEAAARPYRLVELDPQEERVVVYAGGEEGEITGKVQLGELEALVAPGIYF